MPLVAWILLGTNLLTIGALGVVAYQRDKARATPATVGEW